MLPDCSCIDSISKVLMVWLVEQDGVGRNGSHHEAARYGATASLGPKGAQEVNAC